MILFFFFGIRLPASTILAPIEFGVESYWTPLEEWRQSFSNACFSTGLVETMNVVNILNCSCIWAGEGVVVPKTMDLLDIHQAKHIMLK